MSQPESAPVPPAPRGPGRPPKAPVQGEVGKDGKEPVYATAQDWLAALCAKDIAAALQEPLVHVTLADGTHQTFDVESFWDSSKSSDVERVGTVVARVKAVATALRQINPFFAIECADGRGTFYFATASRVWIHPLVGAIPRSLHPEVRKFLEG